MVQGTRIISPDLLQPNTLFRPSELVTMCPGEEWMGWMGVGDHGRSTPFRPQQTEYCSYDGVDTVGLASISADVNSLNVGERGWGWSRRDSETLPHPVPWYVRNSSDFALRICITIPPAASPVRSRGTAWNLKDWLGAMGGDRVAARVAPPKVITYE